jgi:hypothetical protein
VIGAILLVGCSQQGTGPTYEQGSSQSSRNAASDPLPQARPAPLPSNTSQQDRTGRQDQLSFLQRIREADPQYQTIERALMNDRNELGVILGRNVSMDDIPALMRSLLKQMAAQFPGENLTVVAYAPANPPIAIGTAQLNAGTREMTYTPTQQQRR